MDALISDRSSDTNIHLQLIVSSQKPRLGTLAAPAFLTCFDNQAIGSPFPRSPSFLFDDLQHHFGQSSSDELLHGVVAGCFISRQIGSCSIATDLISVVNAEDRICNQPQNFPHGAFPKGPVCSILESRGWKSVD